jgi:hypothetical protein
MHPFDIFVFSVKVTRSNFGQTINPFLSLHYLMSLPAATFGFRFWMFRFNVQMLYLPGLKQVIADFLSPPPPPQPTGDVDAAAATTPIDFEAMTAKQNHCLETHNLLADSSLTVAFWQAGVQCLVGDVSTGDFSPVVLEKFWKDIFSHHGKLAYRQFVSSIYVWHSLAKDVAARAKTFLHCQQSKIHRHARTQPLHILILQWRFSYRHIDLVGPLQYKQLQLYLPLLIAHPNGWKPFLFLLFPQQISQKH